MKRKTNYAAFENKVIEIPIQLNARLKGLKHSKELILVNLPWEDQPLPGRDKINHGKFRIMMEEVNPKLLPCSQKVFGTRRNCPRAKSTLLR